MVMNSQERIMAACERQRADCPATSLRCTPEAWEALQAHLGVQTPNQVLDRLDIDLRWIYQIPFVGPAERSAIPLGSEGTDYWGCHIRQVNNEFNSYFEFYDPPLAFAQTKADVEAYAWPSLDWWDYSALPRIVEEMTQADRRAILFWAGGAFETPWYMRGMEQFLLDLQLNPEVAEAISDRVSAFYQQRTLRAIDAARGLIDLIGSGGDIGGQTGMMLSPASWRAHIKPYQTRLITPFKRLGFRTFYHSCGSLVPAIPDLIEMGLDVLDPIQPGATGMAPAELFPQFGDRLSFHGAIDEQELLPHGTPGQVYDETTRTMDILGQNGGYIVSPSHQVQGDTPVENILAVYEAARAYRWQ
jgi:uroporphyrinogen decarboxylase